jgi:hypothetical protein
MEKIPSVEESGLPKEESIVDLNNLDKLKAGDVLTLAKDPVYGSLVEKIILEDLKVNGGKNFTDLYTGELEGGYLVPKEGYGMRANILPSQCLNRARSFDIIDRIKEELEKERGGVEEKSEEEKIDVPATEISVEVPPSTVPPLEGVGLEETPQREPEVEKTIPEEKVEEKIEKEPAPQPEEVSQATVLPKEETSSELVLHKGQGEEKMDPRKKLEEYFNSVFSGDSDETERALEGFLKARYQKDQPDNAPVNLESLQRFVDEFKTREAFDAFLKERDGGMESLVPGWGKILRGVGEDLLPRSDSFQEKISHIDALLKEKKQSGASNTDREVVKLRAERADLSKEYWKGYIAHKTEEESSPLDGKKWAELTPEERAQKYEKTFALREKIWNLRQAREEVVLDEARIRTKHGKNFLQKKDFIEKTEPEFVRARETYEKARAEYVGAKAWRAMRERTAKLEATIEKRTENSSVFEKLKKGWRKLGELNITRALEPKGKVGRFFGRMASLRTASSVGLLGISALTGVGSAVGLTAFAARKVLSGAGMAFTSYDLMKNFSEKKDLTFTEKDLVTLSVPKLEEKMARFEGWALLSGTQVLDYPEYQLLRQTLAERIDESLKENTEPEKMSEALLSLDEQARKGELALSQEDIMRKLKAVGVGVASGVAFSFVGKIISNSLAGEGSAGVKEGVAPSTSGVVKNFSDTLHRFGATINSYKEFIEHNSFFSSKEVLTGANPPAITEGLESTPPTSFSGVSGVAVAEAVPGHEAGQIVETVREGGSLWRAGKTLVRSGQITKEEFAKAWTSPFSGAKVAGGVHHISDMNLVHAGDRLVYVPATGSEPAHFTVLLEKTGGAGHSLLATQAVEASHSAPTEVVSGNTSVSVESAPSAQPEAESFEVEALSDYGKVLHIGYQDFSSPEVGVADDQGTREKPCTFLDIFALIARVTNWLIAMSGIYAIYNIISNGFWLVLSQGNEESITTHKKGVTNAILGLCLVMIAFMIINFVINAILVSGKPGFKLDLTNPTCYLSPTTQNQCFVPATKQ